MNATYHQATVIKTSGGTRVHPPSHYYVQTSQGFVIPDPPMGFYVNIPESAPCKWSTMHGKYAKRNHRHPMPGRSLECQDDTWLKRKADEFRKMFWEDMKSLVRLTRWEDLYQYFDGHDLYFQGAYNLWNILHLLIDENVAVNEEIKKAKTDEINTWVRTWLSSDPNFQRLMAWNGVDDILSAILNPQDWRDGGIAELNNVDLGTLRDFFKDYNARHAVFYRQYCDSGSGSPRLTFLQLESNGETVRSWLDKTESPPHKDSPPLTTIPEEGPAHVSTEEAAELQRSISQPRYPSLAGGDSDSDDTFIFRLRRLPLDRDGNSDPDDGQKTPTGPKQVNHDATEDKDDSPETQDSWKAADFLPQAGGSKSVQKSGGKQKTKSAPTTPSVFSRGRARATAADVRAQTTRQKQQPRNKKQEPPLVAKQVEQLDQVPPVDGPLVVNGTWTQNASSHSNPQWYMHGSQPLAQQAHTQYFSQGNNGPGFYGDVFRGLVPPTGVSQQQHNMAPPMAGPGNDFAAFSAGSNAYRPGFPPHGGGNTNASHETRMSSSQFGKNEWPAQQQSVPMGYPPVSQPPYSSSSQTMLPPAPPHMSNHMVPMANPPPYSSQNKNGNRRYSGSSNQSKRPNPRSGWDKTPHDDPVHGPVYSYNRGRRPKSSVTPRRQDPAMDRKPPARQLTDQPAMYQAAAGQRQPGGPGICMNANNFGTYMDYVECACVRCENASRSVYVSRIDSTVSNPQLHTKLLTYMGQFGSVENVFIRTQPPRCAFVRFANCAMAIHAVRTCENAGGLPAAGLGTRDGLYLGFPTYSKFFRSKESRDARPSGLTPSQEAMRLLEQSMHRNQVPGDRYVAGWRVWEPKPQQSRPPAPPNSYQGPQQHGFSAGFPGNNPQTPNMYQTVNSMAAGPGPAHYMNPQHTVSQQYYPPSSSLGPPQNLGGRPDLSGRGVSCNLPLATEFNPGDEDKDKRLPFDTLDRAKENFRSKPPSEEALSDEGDETPSSSDNNSSTSKAIRVQLPRTPPDQIIADFSNGSSDDSSKKTEETAAKAPSKVVTEQDQQQKSKPVIVAIPKITLVHHKQSLPKKETIAIDSDESSSMLKATPPESLPSDTCVTTDGTLLVSEHEDSQHEDTSKNSQENTKLSEKLNDSAKAVSDETARADAKDSQEPAHAASSGNVQANNNQHMKPKRLKGGKKGRVPSEATTAPEMTGDASDASSATLEAPSVDGAGAQAADAQKKLQQLRSKKKNNKNKKNKAKQPVDGDGGRTTEGGATGAEEAASYKVPVVKDPDKHAEASNTSNKNPSQSNKDNGPISQAEPSDGTTGGRNGYRVGRGGSLRMKKHRPRPSANSIFKSGAEKAALSTIAEPEPPSAGPEPLAPVVAVPKLPFSSAPAAKQVSPDANLFSGQKFEIDMMKSQASAASCDKMAYTPAAAAVPKHVAPARFGGLPPKPQAYPRPALPKLVNMSLPRGDPFPRWQQKSQGGNASLRQIKTEGTATPITSPAGTAAETPGSMVKSKLNPFAKPFEASPSPSIAGSTDHARNYSSPTVSVAAGHQRYYQPSPRNPEPSQRYITPLDQITPDVGAVASPPPPPTKEKRGNNRRNQGKRSSAPNVADGTKGQQQQRGRNNQRNTTAPLEAASTSRERLRNQSGEKKDAKQALYEDDFPQLPAAKKPTTETKPMITAELWQAGKKGSSPPWAAGGGGSAWSPPEMKKSGGSPETRKHKAKKDEGNQGSSPSEGKNTPSAESGERTPSPEAKKDEPSPEREIESNTESSPAARLKEKHRRESVDN